MYTFIVLIENLEKVCLVQIDRLNEKWGQWFSRKSRFLFAAVYLFVVAWKRLLHTPVSSFDQKQFSLPVKSDKIFLHNLFSTNQFIYKIHRALNTAVLILNETHWYTTHTFESRWFLFSSRQWYWKTYEKCGRLWEGEVFTVILKA